MMKWRIFSIASAGLAIMLSLGACAHTEQPAVEPIIIVKEVKVIVPVKCQVQRPTLTDAPDSDQALKAASDIFEGAKLLLAGRVLRLAYIGQLEAAFDACAQAPIGNPK